MEETKNLQGTDGAWTNISIPIDENRISENSSLEVLDTLMLAGWHRSLGLRPDRIVHIRNKRDRVAQKFLEDKEVTSEGLQGWDEFRSLVSVNAVTGYAWGLGFVAWCMDGLTSKEKWDEYCESLHTDVAENGRLLKSDFVVANCAILSQIKSLASDMLTQIEQLESTHVLDADQYKKAFEAVKGE